MSMLRRATSFTRSRFASLALLVLAGLACMGCDLGPGVHGSFSRALSVSGPVRVELAVGSGSAQISTGTSGKVEIRADFIARGWLGENPQRIADDVSAHPPIEQSGSVIRIGMNSDLTRNVEFHYTILVPQQTELKASTGSGKLSVNGIRGPATLEAGSGEIDAGNISDDVTARAGSGEITLTAIEGDVQATAGSGDLRFSGIHGEIRSQTGSGDVTIDRSDGSITCSSGSGDLHINGAHSDLRVRTGSGDVVVDGDPATNAFWEAHTGSGDVSITLPPAVNAYLEAHSSSGHIETSRSIVVEEQSRRDLKARLGQGGARIDLETLSGSITLR